LAGKTADKIMGDRNKLNDINDVDATNKWESEKRSEDWFNSHPVPPYNPPDLQVPPPSWKPGDPVICPLRRNR